MGQQLDVIYGRKPLRIIQIQKTLIAEIQLNPPSLLSDLQDLEERPRRMDKLRRSLRSSLRRKKDHSRRHDSGGGGTGGGTGGGSGGGGGGDGERGQNRQGERGSSSSRGGGSAGAGGSQWQMDEVSVRSGTCSFQVKVRWIICNAGRKGPFVTNQQP